MKELAVLARSGAVMALAGSIFASVAFGGKDPKAQTPTVPHCANETLDNRTFLTSCMGDVVSVLRANETVQTLFSRTLNDMDGLSARLKDGRVTENAYMAQMQGHIAVIARMVEGVRFSGEWDVKFTLGEARDLLAERARGRKVVMTTQNLAYD